MKYLLAIVLFYCTTPVLAQNRAQDSAMLHSLEVDWHHAYTKHDITLIKKVLADDFIDIGRTGGRINKAQLLKNFSQDKSEYEYCEPFDMEFKIYADAAIILGKTKEKGITDDKTFENTYFWHDVFIRTKDGWKCVLASVALIPKQNNSPGS